MPEGVKAGTAYVDVDAKLDRLKRDIDKQVNDSVGSAQKKFKSGFAKAAVVGSAAFVGAKAFSFLEDSVHKAADEQQQIAVLHQNLANAGVPKATTDSVDAWITRLQNSTGVLDDNLRPALSNLVTAHIPLRKAQKDLGVALDIAAARGLDVSVVTKAMGKAANGSVGGLGRLGLATKDAAGHTLSFDQILKQAQERMGGAAAAKAGTYAGKLDILKARWADMQETIGGALLPVLAKLGDWLVKIVDFVSRNSAVIVPLVLVVGSAAAAFKVASIAMGIFNAVMAANPVVLVIAAIAALVVGLVVAYQKVGWFRAAVDAVWHALQAAFNWVRDNWPLLLVLLTGPIGAAVLIFMHNKDKIIGALRAVVDWVRSNWPVLLAILTGPVGIAVLLIQRNLDRIKGAFHSVAQAIEAAWNGLGGVFRSIMHGIVHGLYEGLNAALGILLDVVDGYNSIPGVPHIKGLPRHITEPSFDKGGIVPGPIGAPLHAIVHGGEEVLTPAQRRERSGRTTNNTFNIFQTMTPEQILAQQEREERLAYAG